MANSLIILPMHHSKSVKTFNLATNLSDFSQEASAGVRQRLRLHTNLFDQEAPERSKIIRFQEQRAYDYVGVKELKAYYERARRVSKDKRKDTMTISMGISRHSVVSRQDEELYNKWQILQRVETKMDPVLSHNNSVLEKIDLTERHTPPQAPLRPTPSLKLKTRRTDVRQTDTSSVLRMRTNFQNYQEGWQREEKRVEKTKGFPSLLRLATESRSMSLKKALDEQSYKKENIPSRQWASVLRNDRELKNIYDQSVTRYTQKGQLGLSGKNKLILEKEWLSQKGDEGYKFQLIKKHKYVA